MARLTKGSFLMKGTLSGSAGVYTITLSGTWKATDKITVAGKTITAGSTTAATIATAIATAISTGTPYTAEAASSVVTVTEKSGFYGIGVPACSTDSAAGVLTLATTTSSGTWAKLADITEYPDMDQDLATEDSTTLSDAAHTYIAALPDSGGAYTFNTWLKAADGAAISALAGTIVTLAFWIGGSESGGVITPTGSVFRRMWTGEVAYQIKGAGTAEIAPASISTTIATVPVDAWGVDI